MKEFTVAMALVDFIPVIFFGWGAIIFQRLMYEKMSKGQYALFSAGTIDITMAGIFKALYKFLYAAKICDFELLKDVFLPVQSLGFLLAGLGVLHMVFDRKDRFMVKSVVPPVLFSGRFIFIILMVLGLGCMDAGICVQAAKDNKKKVIPFLVISFLISLFMGAMSSKDFDKAIYNWIAEIVNTCGQGLFLSAAYIYKKPVKTLTMQSSAS